MGKRGGLLIAIALFAATVHAQEGTTEMPEEEETTTMPPGWGWPVPTGDTAAFGQILAVTDLAGSNTQSNPSVVEGTQGNGGTMDMTVTNTQQADLTFETDSWTDGGGGAIVDGASSAVDAAYASLLQGALYNSTISFTGATAGGIISNPQTSASMSAGSLIVSSSGQVSEGTNVNPGANNNGWGWGNQGNGWDQGSIGWRVEAQTTTQPPSTGGWPSGNSGSGWGWNAPQVGETASASSLELIENGSQQATASDNITGIAVSDSTDSPLSLIALITANVALDGEFNGNGVDVTAGDASAGTSWQNLEYSSYPTNEQNLTVTDADAIAVSAQPSSQSTVSFGSVTVSDWATANSGSNLVNQNSGGWGSQGWGQQSNQGWGQQSNQPAQGWGMAKPGRS